MQDLNGLYRKIALPLILVMMLGCGGVEQTPLVIERVVTATSILDKSTPRPSSMLATDTPRPTSIPPTRTPRPTSVPPTSTPRPPAPTPGIGSTMVSPVDGMVMVYVPEGTFLMGSTSADGDAHSNEFPQHEVYLDAFWIDRTEVTNAMYAAFLNARGNQLERGATWLDADDEDARIHKRGGVWEADAGYEDHPVIEVSWYGAQAYCEWAGRRLPTEAEWEKAARGTEGQLYPWGDEPPTCSLAQYVGCEGQTVPVGSKPDGESPYGAWDMAGNVWEWVADWYDADYYETLPAENPLGPGSGTYRGLRGGSWYYYPGYVRAAIRGSYYRYNAFDDLGFRCGRSP